MTALGWDWTLWHPANNGNSRFRWFVCRGTKGLAYDNRADGRLRRFASYEAALRRAVELNRKEGAT